MTNPLAESPYLLPLDESLHRYLTSPTFLPNNIWKTTFSPCSHYLAIPKQDIYGHDCIVIIFCPNWHANSKTDQLYVHQELKCSSTVWSLAFGQSNCSRRGHSNLSSSSVNRRYDFTKDLFLAAGLADGKIHIWNIDTGELTLILTDHKSTVCGLAFTAGSMQLASCSYDKTIKFWDLLDDGNMYKTLNQWVYVTNAVKWSPDERMLCAVGPLAILYETMHWKEIFQLDGHEHTIVDCTFSSDSAILATASYDTRVSLWSTITGELFKQFVHQIPVPLKMYAGGDNGAFVRSVVFNKDDRFLITTCDDNKIRWFSVEASYRSKSMFERTQNNVLCVATASDGKTVAVGTRTGEVHLWSTAGHSMPALLKDSCRFIINSQSGLQRKNIVNLPISRHLINYLLHKDMKMR